MNFQQNATWKKHDFFTYKAVISFFPKKFGLFLINHSRKFGKIFYFIENSTFFPFWRKNSTLLLWKEMGKKP
jgi:hypothetical protein